jgi:hypothetical protein
MALLCACPRTCLATNAVVRIGHGHDFVAHIIAEVILAFEWFFNKFKHISATDLEATSAAYAFISIYRFYKTGRPCVTTSGMPYNSHISSFLKYAVSNQLSAKTKTP